MSLKESAGALTGERHNCDEQAELARLNLSLAVEVENLRKAERNLQEEIARREELEKELLNIKWLLGEEIRTSAVVQSEPQPYGNLVQINSRRVLADGVGEETLKDIAGDYLDLLETSAAIYERNGDYAMGLFTSGWCKFMDNASRNLCGTADNVEALAGGKWHCHESCWQTSRTSIERNAPTDLECAGGIRIYAVPVRAGGEVVGSINFGYGNPPTDDETLAALSGKYGVGVEELRHNAEEYRARPSFIVELAKSRLRTSAKLIGEILERKRIEQELERSNEELEQFAYVASHDLQEPLRMISSFTQLLDKRYRGRLDADADEFIGFIVDGSARMQQLIRDLLDYSRINRHGEAHAQVSCREALAQALSNLRSSIEESKAIITCDELPATVTGEREQLARLFQNLIGNSIKFRGDSPPQIHISAQARPGEWLFSVRDNGIGIEPEYAERIFMIFQRLHGRSAYEGTGIGLAICKKIVERHGGRIWVESVLGAGATFYFTIGKQPHDPALARPTFQPAGHAASRA